MSESKNIDKEPHLNSPEKVLKIYSGKIGVFGQHTSGKTRLIFGLLNFAIKKNIHIWDEEENHSGTSLTHPFTVEWGDTKKKLLIIDNPGQNHFQTVRNYVAKSSEPYNAIIIVLDSIAWNFRKIPFLQVKKILELMDYTEIPIINVITKLDLLNSLLRDEQIDVIARKLVHSIQGIKNGDRIPYYNRKQKKTEWKVFESENSYVSFQILEQLFTNAVEDLLMKNPIPELSKSNIRILIRALLLGYSELLVTWLSLPEYKKLYKDVIIPENLEQILSNYRGTILESGIKWNNQIKNSESNEIIFPIDIFDYTRILDIFKRVVLLSKRDNQFKNELFELSSKILPSCKILDPIFVDNNNRKNYQVLNESLKKIASEFDFSLTSKKEKPKFSLHKDPPLKPKPKKFS